MADEALYVRVAPEIAERLERDWSEPVQLRVGREDGDELRLTMRTVDRIVLAEGAVQLRDPLLDCHHQQLLVDGADLTTIVEVSWELAQRALPTASLEPRTDFGRYRVVLERLD